MYSVINTTSEFEQLIRIYRINIEIVFERIRGVAATTEIKPLKHPDGTDDFRALDDYNSFIINVLEVFAEHDYEIIREHESPYSHSYYCTLVKRDQLEQEVPDYKYILFIRISDHENRKDSKQATRKYYDDRAQELKQPVTKAKQTWRLKEITVNKNTYFSYEDALDDIDKRLD